MPGQLDIEAAFEKYIATRKKGFSIDRTKTVGASEIEMCAKRIAMRKRNLPIDPGADATNGFALRGDVIEDNVTVPVMRIALKQVHPDAELLYSGQSEQISLVAPGCKLSATPDGLAVNVPRDVLANYNCPDIESNCFVAEMKSFDPRSNTSYFPKPEHVGQVQVQLGLLRADADGVAKAIACNQQSWKPTWALIVYVNASNVKDVKCYPVRFNEKVFESYKKRAAMIMGIDPAQIRPEGKIRGGKECVTCERSSQCFGYVPFVPHERRAVDPKTADKLVKVAVEINRLKGRAEEIETKVKIKEAELKEALAAAKTKELDHKNVELKWEVRKGAETVDNKAVQEAFTALGGNLSLFKKQNKPSESLKINLH